MIFKKINKKEFDNFVEKLKTLSPEYTKTFKDLIQKSKSYIQTNSNKIFKKGDQEVNLKPSTLWATSITWTLLGGTFLGVTWLAIAKTDEIVIVQGKLEPIGGVVEVKIPFQGVVKNILIKEGQMVKEGETLIKLDTEISRSKQQLLQKSLVLNEDILDRLKYLFSEGAVSEIQYLEQKNKIAEIKDNIIQNDVALKYQNIKAPISGYIFNLKPQEPGFVANSSEALLQIVPKNKLKAKVEINSQKIGFIKVGQLADVSIDSYPATDFGVISGEVKRISSDALNPEPSLGKGFRFPADITIKEQSLKLKNGKTLPLQTGMSLTANIKLRKVSYLRLLLGTFSDKADSLRAL